MNNSAMRVGGLLAILCQTDSEVMPLKKCCACLIFVDMGGVVLSSDLQG